MHRGSQQSRLVKSRIPRKTIALFVVVASAAAVPGVAHARLLFGFARPQGPAPAAGELQADLLQRLERTGHYALIEMDGMIAGGSEPLPPLCEINPALNKVARVQLRGIENDRFAAIVKVYDCDVGRPDPVTVEATSGSLKSLAGSLRSDFIEAYPFLLDLEVTADTLWVPAGPDEDLHPGMLLYGYVEEAPRAYRLVRRLKVEQFQEAGFRSELRELWRMPDTGEPQAGEIVTATSLITLPSRELIRPVLASVPAVRQVAGPEQFSSPGSYDPPISLAEAGLAPGEFHFVRVDVPAGFGWRCDVVALPTDGPLTFGWRAPPRRGTDGGHVLQLLPGEFRAGNAGRLPIEPIARGVLPEAPFTLEILAYGPFAEFYVNGAFAGGFEDHALEGGALLVTGDGTSAIGNCRLFALGTPVGESE